MASERSWRIKKLFFVIENKLNNSLMTLKAVNNWFCDIILRWNWKLFNSHQDLGNGIAYVFITR